MQKIPTLFMRDPDDRAHVLPEVNPACRWAIDGEGVATRKYDGTAVMKDHDGTWWARRVVKVGKAAPAGFRTVQVDNTTGKIVGWEPIDASPFHKHFLEALARAGNQTGFGTYELCGPKINGNPEQYPGHFLVPHEHAEHQLFAPHLYPLSFDVIRRCVLANKQDEGWEGLVWHNEDGRMAKIKARDFKEE